MNTKSVGDFLHKVDTKPEKGFNERCIYAGILDILNRENIEKTDCDQAELMAFDFVENYPDNETGWGTYFGPALVFIDDNGNKVEQPSIDWLSSQIIGYWEMRLSKVSNPIMKARYAGLICDFKYKKTGINPSHSIKIAYIDSLLNQFHLDLNHYDFYSLVKLERAVRLSIAISDTVRIDNCRRVIIDFERKYSEDSKPGVWFNIYNILLCTKKIGLTIDEEADSILQLENKLQRISSTHIDNSNFNRLNSQSAAEILANYYRKKQRIADIKRVLLLVENAFNHMIKDVSYIQGYGYKEAIYNLYKRFDLNEDSNRILIELEDMARHTISDLDKKIYEFSIDKKELDNYIIQRTSGTSQEVINNIACLYIPVIDDIKNKIFKYSNESPLSFIIPRKILSDSGMVVASVGSLKDDPDGHIALEMSKKLSIDSFLLRKVIEEGINNGKLNKNEILIYIKKSPLIKDDRLAIIERALDAYFSDDLLTAIHLLVPQIEEAIRNMLKLSGGSILKPSKSGGYHLKTFDEILRDDIIVKGLTEDFANYLRILFTDSRGWNIRNIVCHGMAPLNMFNNQNTDRVLHALICIGLIVYDEN